MLPSFLRGGVVAYQESVKRGLLGVVAESVLLLNCARQMASGVCELLGADVGAATTGVAGDEPEGGVMPGTVFIGVAVEGEATARRYVFSGESSEVCDQATRQALSDLLDALLIGVAVTPDLHRVRGCGPQPVVERCRGWQSIPVLMRHRSPRCRRVGP